MDQELRESLNFFQLSKKKMVKVCGGGSWGCHCACAYWGTPGGSSPFNNDQTNDKFHLSSPD